MPSPVSPAVTVGLTPLAVAAALPGSESAARRQKWDASIGNESADAGIQQQGPAPLPPVDASLGLHPPFTLADSGADTLGVNHNPVINDTRITALQFLWLASPLAATVAVFIAMKRFEKRVEKLKAAQEGTDAPANQTIVGSASARPPPAPRNEQESPRPSVSRAARVKAPTLGLERSARLQPLVQTLLEPSTRSLSASPVGPDPPQMSLPEPVQANVPASSALDATVSATANAARSAVDSVADQLAVRGEQPAPFLVGAEGAEAKSADGSTVASDSDHIDEFAVSADLLLRMPYLPFLGLGLPTLLLKTRAKNQQTLQAAYAAQPRLERLGLRLLLATHLPAPTTSLRKWIFRTRWARMQRWPPLLAFLTAAVVLPTAVPTVFACAQYVIASLSGAQGWSNPLAVATIRKALHLTSDVSDATAIGLGFLYESLVGVWWDIIPISSADWGNGLGFSGASWILLAICEESGWLGALFPLLYYNPYVRDWAAKCTQWWYHNAPENNSTPSSVSSVSTASQSVTARNCESARGSTSLASAPSLPERPQDVRESQSLNAPAGVSQPPTATVNSVGAAVKSPHTRVDVAATPPSQGHTIVPSASSVSSVQRPPRGVAREWILTTLVCLILGTIWSAWHWPFILLKGFLPAGVGYVPGTVDTPLGQEHSIMQRRS